MKLSTSVTAIGLAVFLIAAGCDRADVPTNSIDGSEEEAGLKFTDVMPIPIEIEKAMGEMGSQAAYANPVPEPLVSVTVAGSTLEFWPYTGTNFAGVPQDPINLIFYGDADPRDIRAALLALDGDRSGTPFPPVPPFTSTWKDCIGDVQTGYGSESGWTGGVIQLALGDYESLRIHIRLFKVGSWTIANAHCEVLIPGTTDHQVLSWELAEQLVMADMMRTGLLDTIAPIIPTGAINEAPFGTIQAVIYNGLPVELRMLIGGPLGDVTDDVAIASDGHATIINLARHRERLPDEQELDFVLNFDQIIPKPFCSSEPYEYVYVSGPVILRQSSRLTPGGSYLFGFVAKGELSVAPVNPTTGEIVGEPLSANVFEYHGGQLSDYSFDNASITFQQLLPSDADGAGRFFKHLHINSSGVTGYREAERCASGSSGKIGPIAGNASPDILRPGRQSAAD